MDKENVGGFYGQEINLTTYNLARINMLLQNVNYEQFSFALGDTLVDPKHRDDKLFDAIVVNPPYSIKWEGDFNSLLIDDERFSPAGVLAPKSKDDLAFVMHILSCLTDDNTAAIVEFPGVLYRRKTERKIRKYLVDNNYVDAVIHLPPDLFFGTTIGTCIIVLKKKSKTDKSVLFVVSSEQFTRSGNKNNLTEDNQDFILNTLQARENVDNVVALVPNDKGENDYNIAVSSYCRAERYLHKDRHCGFERRNRTHRRPPSRVPYLYRCHHC